MWQCDWKHSKTHVMKMNMCVWTSFLVLSYNLLSKPIETVLIAPVQHLDSASIWKVFHTGTGKHLISQLHKLLHIALASIIHLLQSFARKPWYLPWIEIKRKNHTDHEGFFFLQHTILQWTDNVYQVHSICRI